MLAFKFPAGTSPRSAFQSAKLNPVTATFRLESGRPVLVPPQATLMGCVRLAVINGF